MLDEKVKKTLNFRLNKQIKYNFRWKPMLFIGVVVLTEIEKLSFASMRTRLRYIHLFKQRIQMESR